MINISYIKLGYEEYSTSDGIIDQQSQYLDLISYRIRENKLIGIVDLFMQFRTKVQLGGGKPFITGLIPDKYIPIIATACTAVCLVDNVGPLKCVAYSKSSEYAGQIRIITSTTIPTDAYVYIYASLPIDITK